MTRKNREVRRQHKPIMRRESAMCVRFNDGHNDFVEILTLVIRVVERHSLPIQKSRTSQKILAFMYQNPSPVNLKLRD